jgi:hypothetical protein
MPAFMYSRYLTNEAIKRTMKKKKDKEIEEEMSLDVLRGNELHDVLVLYQSAQLSPALSRFVCSDGNGCDNGTVYLRCP